jgi:multicomponent K+:H+ antiporter subunit A
MDNGWIVAALATVGALFSVAYAFRLIAHVFLGPVRDDYPATPHDPGPGLWLAPAVLVVLAVLIGLMPMTFAGELVRVAAGAATGVEPYVDIYLWHGFVPALFLSIAAVGGGMVVLGLHRPLDRAWNAMPRPEAKRLFDAVVEPLARLARAITDGLHDGAASRYLMIFMVAVLAAGAGAFWMGGHAPGMGALTPVLPVPVIGFVLLAVCSVMVAALHRYRLVALVLIGVIGLTVSLTFIYLSAPDLALTQISVEVATVMLLLLALNFLPKRSPRDSSGGRRLRDMVIAGGAGLGSAALILALMTRDFAFPTISDFHIANAKTGGGGTNVVNVILVDFRGYDTFGEIIVLGIAALVIYALTEALLRGEANRRLLAWVPDQRRAGDRHPLMLVVATRMILPIAIVVGVFIFLRGHNEPGGGFIAGLVVAIAFLMQYMASGFAWAEARQRVDYHALIACGILIAAATGVGAWLADRPFLTSAFGYFRIPPMDKFELATAMAFDLGVFLTVLGAVLLALASLSRIAIRAGETVNVSPMDVDPSAPPRSPGEA